MEAQSSIPTATYRLQSRRELPLQSVSALIPHLDQLGLSDLYLSPIYTARPGSIHGYDVVDHGRPTLFAHLPVGLLESVP